MTSWSPPSWIPGGYVQPIDPRQMFMPAGYQQPQWYNPEAYRMSSPPATQQRSSKYPSLNPILAEDTTLLRYDLKQKLSTSIMASIYFSHRPTLVLATATHRLRLISKSFPWQIDITSQANITCGDVWEALYAGLQEPIADSEWGFIIQDGKKKEAIEKAVKKRMDTEPMGDKRPKRIDYLGDTTLFRGLEKDDDYAKLRHLPHSPTCNETWVIKLIS